jgi:hypothetical protein
MKRRTFWVVIILFVVIIIGGLLPVSSLHAIGPIASVSSSGHTRFPISHRTIPSRPFSGIVEGTVLSISTTSITIYRKNYQNKTGTSTEITFALVSDVRINVDQGGYATSSMSDISIGSLASLVIERIGNNAGKVREILLQSN